MFQGTRRPRLPRPCARPTNRAAYHRPTNDTDRDTAERCTILRGLVGSTVHGLNVNDGIEDRDEMGICVEPFDVAMSLGPPFEQCIYRSAAEREGRPDARSSAGDLDLVIYSLRKWMRLALKASPTILLPLFTPEDQLVTCDDLGRELRALAPAIVSRRAQAAYLGYLQAQKQRLTGERGQKRIHRPELEAMYGFDTKYAMHMLRLGFQGVELLTRGRLSLPMQEPARSFLLDVRRGKVSEQECLARAEELERQLGLIRRSRTVDLDANVYLSALAFAGTPKRAIQLGLTRRSAECAATARASVPIPDRPTRQSGPSRRVAVT